MFSVGVCNPVLEPCSTSPASRHPVRPRRICRSFFARLIEQVLRTAQWREIKRDGAAHVLTLTLVCGWLFRARDGNGSRGAPVDAKFTG